jgi:hypothetical protein
MSTLTRARVRPEVERLFFTGMTLALFAAVFLGFARTYFLRAFFPEFTAQHGAPETIFYVHGTAVVLWYVLLVVQARLVAARRIDLHRTLGWAGAVLAGLMIVLGMHGALVAARRPGGFMDIPVPPLQFLVVPFFDMVLFALFVGLAISQRKDPQAHKRWMLIASIAILTAAIARWPFGFIATGGPPMFFGVTDLFLLPLLAWDLATRRRPHVVTVVGGLLLVASQPLRLMLSGTPLWNRFAEWLIG